MQHFLLFSNALLGAFKPSKKSAISSKVKWFAQTPLGQKSRAYCTIPVLIPHDSKKLFC